VTLISVMTADARYLCTRRVYHIFAAVLCNTAEDKLLSRLLETKEHSLLSIPAAYHLGRPLHVSIRLAPKKIVKMVRC